MEIRKLLPYHPRVLRHLRRKNGKLKFSDATAMAVGGMIGGGIFSVLGTTIAIAGHLAFACFVVGGAIALLTAHSYARLTLRSGKSGGPFVYLHDAGFPQSGAFTAWLLILGYMIALAVYAFTFGHYAASIFGVSENYARVFALVILGIFLFINIRGVAASALTEDAIVFVKLLILVVIASVGISHFSAARLTPLANNGLSSIFLGATSIFVAYEGFELLSYDYDDVNTPKKTVPRALYAAVLIVIAVYVLVTIGSQMLVPSSVIIAQKEVAFAAVGQAAFGAVGKWIATLAALLATSSAINATLFSSARQIHDVAKAGELPQQFGKDKKGLPVSAMVLLTLCGGMFALLPNVLTLLTFGSFVFLCVFGLVNYLAFRIVDRFIEKCVALLATLSCLVAVIVLLMQLIQHDHSSLLLVALCLGVLITARLLFLLQRRVAPLR